MVMSINHRKMKHDIANYLNVIGINADLIAKSGRVSSETSWLYIRRIMDTLNSLDLGFVDCTAHIDIREINGRIREDLNSLSLSLEALRPDRKTRQKIHGSIASIEKVLLLFC